jgi:hypothetical protein
MLKLLFAIDDKLLFDFTSRNTAIFLSQEIRSWVALTDFVSFSLTARGSTFATSITPRQKRSLDSLSLQAHTRNYQKKRKNHY